MTPTHRLPAILPPSGVYRLLPPTAISVAVVMLVSASFGYNLHPLALILASLALLGMWKLLKSRHRPPPPNVSEALPKNQVFAWLNARQSQIGKRPGNSDGDGQPDDQHERVLEVGEVRAVGYCNGGGARDSRLYKTSPDLHELDPVERERLKALRSYLGKGEANEVQQSKEIPSPSFLLPGIGAFRLFEGRVRLRLTYTAEDHLLELDHTLGLSPGAIENPAVTREREREELDELLEDRSAKAPHDIEGKKKAQQGTDPSSSEFYGDGEDIHPITH